MFTTKYLMTAVLALGLTQTVLAKDKKDAKADKKTATATASVQAGKYSIDPAHSKVGFEIAHLVFSTVDGRFNAFEGELNLAEKISDSSVNAKIQIDSIDTGVADRDKHLKSPDFFDSAKYPTMTFKSKKVEGTYEAFKVVGDLQIRDKTLPVTLEGKYLGTANDAWGNTKAMFTLSTKINRKDYGLTWNKLVEVGPTVGDEVTITLKIQAAKAK